MATQNLNYLYYKNTNSLRYPNCQNIYDISTDHNFNLIRNIIEIPKYIWQLLTEIKFK